MAMVGEALGLSLPNTSMVPGVYSQRAATAQMAAAGLSPEQVAATLSRMLDQQAYTMAVTDVFWLSSALFVALIGVVWLTKPKLAGGVADKVTGEVAGDAGGTH